MMRSTIRLAFVLVVLAILGFIPNVSVAAATTTGVAAYRLDGTVRGLVEPETVGDPQEALPYANETVSITGGYSGTTGEDGGWVIEVPEDGDYPGTTRLRGLYVDVYRDDGMPEAVLSFLAQPGDPVALLFDDAGSHIAERDAYFHINAIHGWIKKADPNFTALDTPLAVHVNNPNGSCGAFWWQGGLVFFSEGSGCNNTARISDVVYHEYAHGITRALYAPDPAPVSSGMDEAYSDIAAMTIHDDPEIGENFLETGGYIRTGENLRQYPGTECGGDIFCRSEILSGAMWKVRKNLDLLYGPEAAAPIFDDLHVRTMKEKPTQMPEFLLRLLANDDNDGDLTNGTPHWHEICDAFALHNLCLLYTSP
ncbi:MAG: hypothetical protein QUU85_16255, partial [Candidatus Eisenbacteria bacterium]|nr:hypothetical protein [Candidatus Eisenbacteria bacterium]